MSGTPRLAMGFASCQRATGERQEDFPKITWPDPFFKGNAAVLDFPLVARPLMGLSGCQRATRVRAAPKLRNRGLTRFLTLSGTRP